MFSRQLARRDSIPSSVHSVSTSIASGYDSDTCPMSPVSEFGDGESEFPSFSFRRFSSSTGVNVPAQLSTAKVEGMPTSCFYIPNFISEQEEKLLLDKIAAAPIPHWTVLAHRRLITYPSALTPNNILLNSPLPLWLAAPFIPRMQSLNLWGKSLHGQPNHVLINEYHPGEGIMPHEDGPAYHPIVATISLGAPIVLDVYEKGDLFGVKNLSLDAERTPKYRILQEPRSLLITTDELYTQHLHGIARKEVDENLSAETIVNWDLLGDKEEFALGKSVRGTRTSLTYRDVLRVSNITSSKLFGRR